LRREGTGRQGPAEAPSLPCVGQQVRHAHDRNGQPHVEHRRDRRDCQERRAGPGRALDDPADRQTQDDQQDFAD
jgi:hypothetical protein